MKESDTYMAILEEGEAKGEIKGERNLLLLLGRKRLGEPDAAMLAALEAITSPKRLEQLGERLLDVESWAELLA
ncbi:MAG TPA: DUF4351 domain-containing protein [Chthonomonadaceae bacterium]|nr:DUF4351 domain-containing protein [Chthonomonadaceae bacterium]